MTDETKIALSVFTVLVVILIIAVSWIERKA